MSTLLCNTCGTKDTHPNTVSGIDLCQKANCQGTVITEGLLHSECRDNLCELPKEHPHWTWCVDWDELYEETRSRLFT